MAVTTKNTRRVRQSAIDTQMARDRIVDAVMTQTYAQGKNKPATYGNVRPRPATARQRAENAAYARYQDMATGGKSNTRRKTSSRNSSGKYTKGFLGMTSK